MATKKMANIQWLKRPIPLVVMVLGVGLWAWFYFFFQFWTHVDPSGFSALMVYGAEGIHGDRGRQVLIHRDFYPHAEVLRVMARSRGVELVVTQGYRAPGKPVRDTVVTPAVRSNHLAGHALDMNPRYRGKTYTSEDMNWTHFGELPPPVQDFLMAVRDHGLLRWGGSFSTPDVVHVDLPLNLEDEALWNRYYQECARDYFAAPPLWKVRLTQIRHRLFPGRMSVYRHKTTAGE
ncbi:MAG: M15 family metallopeptidase [Desulfobacterales bacterium]|nr:M15 family metallopeptidase [Desulfobacterales bacterium]